MCQYSGVETKLEHGFPALKCVSSIATASVNFLWDASVSRSISVFAKKSIAARFRAISRWLLIDTAAAINAPPAINAVSHCGTVPKLNGFDGRYNRGSPTNSHAE